MFAFHCKQLCQNHCIRNTNVFVPSKLRLKPNTNPNTNPINPLTLLDPNFWQCMVWDGFYRVGWVLSVLPILMVKTDQFTTKCKGVRVIALKRQISLW